MGGETRSVSSMTTPQAGLPPRGRETEYSSDNGITWRGLPPRGRGNLERAERDREANGSTPAWAGKPFHWSTSLPWRRVYPRVGGETVFSADGLYRFTGLPPRGRGNLHAGHCGRRDLRSTPAWAGKPPSPAARWPGVRVYPRVGGETAYREPRGSSAYGLPPRGRGNRPVNPLIGLGCGSTPAWAGKPRGQPLFPR